MSDISGLVEGTAKLEGYGTGKKAFKDWVDANTQLILVVASSGMLSCTGFRLPFTHPRVVSVDGTVKLSELLYHALRCALYHDGLGPGDVEFTSHSFSNENGKTQIPGSVVTGLVIAVLGSHVHADQTLKGPFTASGGKYHLDIQRFWGKKQALYDAFRFLAVAR